MKDLSKLSDAEIATEMKRRATEKNENRETYKELVSDSTISGVVSLTNSL